MSKTLLYPRYIRVAFLACMALLSACSSVVRTDIQTFRDENATFSTGTIRVIPETNEEPVSLEFRYYQERLEQRLSSMGYTPVADENAEFVAKLGYSVSRQEKDRPHSRILVSGGFYGYGHRAGRNALFFGGGNNGAEFEYVRDVSLSISKPGTNDPGVNVMQVEASSTGKCEHLTVVFDEILEAIFSNFLRADGSIEKVSVDGSAKCP